MSVNRPAERTGGLRRRERPVPPARRLPPGAVPEGPGGGHASPRGAGSSGRRRWEFLYFALRNTKLMIGLGVELIFVLVAIFGPLLAPYEPSYRGPPAPAPLGPAPVRHDVPSGRRFLPGALRLARQLRGGFLGALFAGAVGLVVGFAAG